MRKHAMDLSKLATWWATTPSAELVWLAVGLSAQVMFSMRFLLQWVASERARRSIVPEAFWYFSFVGGLMLFAYAIYRMDPVFILGQGGGLLIYARNIHFIWKGKSEDRALAGAESAPPASRHG
jgi:lipid-A-disaccharide synthase-like uncharacterized protein